MKVKMILSFWISMLAWVTVIVQLYVLIHNYLHEGKAIGLAILKFFSYFTILTNILVAICASAVYFNGDKKSLKFFSKISVATAIVSNISVVSLIYNLILRALWDPKGVQYFLDESLHVVIPIAFILFWIFCVEKGKLKWLLGFLWLLYPLFYSLYVFILGYFTRDYPYPFIDLNHLSWKVVASNAAIIFFVFLGMNFLFISLDKTMAYFRSKKSPSV